MSPPPFSRAGPPESLKNTREIAIDLVEGCFGGLFALHTRVRLGAQSIQIRLLQTCGLETQENRCIADNGHALDALALAFHLPLKLHFRLHFSCFGLCFLSQKLHEKK